MHFYNETPNLIYTSQPSYDMAKVPNKYKNITTGRDDVYWKMLPELSKFRVQYLDYFQLTHTCYFDNCTSDGGHRSRFVNRWKAQLLLNTLCDYIV
mmetsp:Transcript_24896/g.42369  ORF Transcript_24896/g.42369 Transcript_24896/m.42369 type:complete len:96 (-) Transcript_24896:32-319(-)